MRNHHIPFQRPTSGPEEKISHTRATLNFSSHNPQKFRLNTIIWPQIEKIQEERVVNHDLF